MYRAERVVRKEFLARTALLGLARDVARIAQEARDHQVRPRHNHSAEVLARSIDGVDGHGRADADDAGEPLLALVRGDHTEPAVHAEIARLRIRIANAASGRC